MDDPEEETAPPWLTKLLDGLQDQHRQDLQEQQEQHRRDFNLLRSEIQDLRQQPLSADTPASESSGHDAQGDLPLTSTGTGTVETKAPAVLPITDAARPAAVTPSVDATAPAAPVSSTRSLMSSGFFKTADSNAAKQALRVHQPA